MLLSGVVNNPEVTPQLLTLCIAGCYFKLVKKLELSQLASLLHKPNNVHYPPQDEAKTVISYNTALKLLFFLRIFTPKVE